MGCVITGHGQHIGIIGNFVRFLKMNFDQLLKISNQLVSHFDGLEISILFLFLRAWHSVQLELFNQTSWYGNMYKNYRIAVFSFQGL